MEISPFFECESLAAVAVPEGAIPGEMAFAGCTSLESVTLPASLVSLEEYLFLGCSSLQSIDLPAGLVSIGEGVFHGCALASIALPQGLLSIDNLAFFGCEQLESIFLPASVQDIGEFAFLRCDSLVLTVEPGSYAHRYAMEQGIAYRCAGSAGE